MLGTGALLSRSCTTHITFRLTSLVIHMIAEGVVAEGVSAQKEKSYSEEASSLINKAYDTLRSPLLRASYMVRFGAVTA
jgi:hypothetical protein